MIGSKHHLLVSRAAASLLTAPSGAVNLFGHGRIRLRLHLREASGGDPGPVALSHGTDLANLAGEPCRAHSHQMGLRGYVGKQVDQVVHRQGLRSRSEMTTAAVAKSTAAIKFLPLWFFNVEPELG